jgi:hypothetical protein
MMYRNAQVLSKTDDTFFAANLRIQCASSVKNEG